MENSNPSQLGIELNLNDFTYTPIGRNEPVFKDLSLHIKAGEKVLLTGESGSGKSTILKALAGLIADDANLAEILHPTKQTVLMVQNPLHSFVAGAAGLEIAFAPENYAQTRPEIRSNVHRAAREANFWPSLELSPFELSGGQQQRLSLAASLATNARALLLDEPVTMLDEETQEIVRNAILAAGKNRTLVIADHHPAKWVEHVDRILEVKDAKIFDLSDSYEVRQQNYLLEPVKKSPPLLEIAPRASFNGRRLLAQSVGLKLYPGQFIALTGQSGVGKSSFLQHVLLSSRVLVNKQNELLKAETLEMKKSGWGKKFKFQAAWLPQNPETSFVEQTAISEVMISNPQLRQNDAQVYLSQMGIAHLAQANPFAISGGEQRRLAFASALAADAKILVLDEPSVGLDPKAFAQVVELIKIALAKGKAVIAATHDPRLISLAHEEIKLIPHPKRSDFYPAKVTSEDADIPKVPFKPRTIPTDLLNPITILFASTMAFIGSFWSQSMIIGLVSLLPLIIILPLSFRTPKRALIRLVPILFGVLTLAWSVVLLGGLPLSDLSAWELGFSEGLRVMVMVAPGALLMESIEATRLSAALAQKLKLPARFATTMSVGLNQMGQMFNNFEAILFTRQVRGILQNNPFKLYASAIFALLVATLRTAEIQALAMDARGFSAAKRRTFTHASTFTWHDLWGLLIGLILLTTPIMASSIL